MEVLFPEVSKQDPDIQGVVATWFVSGGESVSQNQLIAEVQVEKVSVEVTAPASGKISLTVPEGAVVPQSTVIAYIE